MHLWSFVFLEQSIWRMTQLLTPTASTSTCTTTFSGSVRRTGSWSLLTCSQTNNMPIFWRNPWQGRRSVRTATLWRISVIFNLCLHELCFGIVWGSTHACVSGWFITTVLLSAFMNHLWWICVWFLEKRWVSERKRSFFFPLRTSHIVKNLGRYGKGSDRSLWIDSYPHRHIRKKAIVVSWVQGRWMRALVLQ